MIVLYTAAATVITTLAAAPLVRELMLRRGVLDVPNHRSSHTAPTPHGGGIACAAGVTMGAVVSAWLGASVPLSAVITAMILAGVGLLDDRLHLAAAPRLGAQIVVGALFGATIGGVGWVIAGVILTPLIVNVVNFMDGINGITALTLLTWGCATTLAGTLYGQQTLAVLGAVTAGASLGFLPFNAPRARIFLGDVGSYLFGALATCGVMLGHASGVAPALIIAPLTVHLADVATTLGRRAWHGAPIMAAHREHIYQRLVREGNIPHFSVAVYSLLVSLSIVLAWSSEIIWFAIAFTVVAIGLYVFSPPLMELLRVRRSTPPTRSRATQ